MKLSAGILSALSDQYRHELENYMFYTLAASEASFRGLEGIAAFLGKQAAGELAHAGKVAAYIVARNEAIIAGSVTPPPATFPDIIALFRAVQDVELGTTRALLAIHALAYAEGDVATCDFLTGPDSLIREQVEEENVTQTILDRIAARIGAGPLDGCATHDMDVFIGGI